MSESALWADVLSDAGRRRGRHEVVDARHEGRGISREEQAAEVVARDRLKDASFKSKRAVFDVVKGEVDKHLGAKFDASLSTYYTTIACALVNAKCHDYDYEEAFKSFDAVKEVRALHEALDKIYGDVEVDDDDDDTADVLADCQFTLAYGSKVLLHNTKLKLRRGHKYALLGGNDSGKSSLMRAIANEQVEG